MQRKRKSLANKAISVFMTLLLALMMFPFTGIVAPSVQAYASEGEETLYPPITELIEGNLDENLVVQEQQQAPNLLDKLREMLFGVERQSMEEAGGIQLVYTMADQSMVGNYTTIDDIWDNVPQAMVGTFRDVVPLYDVSDASEYLVAFVDTPALTNVSELMDIQFFTNDVYNPISLNEQIIYDAENGVAYVPKQMGVGWKGETFSVQAQALYGIDFSSENSKKIDVEIDNRMPGVTAPSKHSVIETNFVDTVLEVPIATPATASKVDFDKVELYVNGWEEPLSKTNDNGDALVSYDSLSGNVIIGMSSFSVSSLKIVLPESDMLSNMLNNEKAYAYSRVSKENMKVLNGNLKLQNVDVDSIKAGDYFGYDGHVTVASKAKPDGWQYSYGITLGGDGGDSIVRAFRDAGTSITYDWLNDQINAHKDYQSSKDSGDGEGPFDNPTGESFTSRVQCPNMVLTSQSGASIDFTGDWPDYELPLMCGHASSSATANGTGTYKIWMRVLFINEDYMIFSLQSPEDASAQENLGIFKCLVESKGSIEIQKSSTDPRTNSNPNYNFKGVAYEVTNSAGQSMGTINLDENGYGAMTDLKFDTYTIKETATNDYFKLDTNTYTETLDGSDTKKTVLGKMLPTQPFSVADEPKYVEFELMKESANPSITQNNKMYTLEGAEYTITNTRTGQVEDVMVTDATGYAKSSAKLLVDDYSVKETKSTLKGHAVDPNTYTYPAGTPGPGGTQKVTKSNGANLDDNAKVDISLEIYKREQRCDGDEAEGGSLLRDAVYKIEYWDVPSEAEKGNATPEHHRSWYVRTDDSGHGDIQTITTDEFTVTTSRANGQSITRTFKSDEPYRQEGEIVIPMGYIEITEVSNPLGHFFDNGTSNGPGITRKYPVNNGDRFTIEYDYSILNDNVSPDAAYRGDMFFDKKNEATQHAMPGIPFLITSNTTGEAHVVVTDENGYVDTRSYIENAEWNLHTYNTNANDAAFTKNADGAWVLQDPSKLDAYAGVWFTGHGPKGKIGLGEKTAPSDKLGALPYDTYTVEELACDANKGMTLVTFTTIIKRDSFPVHNNTVSDKEIRIGTTAVDKNTGSQIGDPSVETVTIVDEVSYINLTPGTKYTMTGTLMDKKTNAPLTDEAGNTFTKSVEFIPEETDGYVSVEFEVPGSVLVGKSTVVFESLSDSVREVAVHADIEDEKQTVDFPGLHTTATDSVTSEHEGQVANEEITVVDEVAYSGLRPGVEYEISGKLMDKATGGELADENGNIFTASITFTPESEEGTVKLEFKVPRSVIAGKTVVAFEYLYQNGKEIGHHADINDLDQTVYYPNVHTTATDNITNNHIGFADETVTINDVVKYENLLYGKNYRLDGVLMDKATGESIKDANGNEITASVEFVAGQNRDAAKAQQTVDAFKSAAEKLVQMYAKNPVDLKDVTYSTIDEDVYKNACKEIELRTTSTEQASIGSIAIFYDYYGMLSAEEQKAIEVPSEDELVDAMDVILEQNIANTKTEESASANKEALARFVETAKSWVDALAEKNITTFEGADGTEKIPSASEITKAAEGLVGNDYRTSAEVLYTVVSAAARIDDGEQATELMNTNIYGIVCTTRAYASAPAIEVDENGRVSGEVLVSFAAPKAAVIGKTTVVFEELYGESGVTGEFIIVAEHKDINDEGQTVYYPEIKTLAHSDNEFNEHNAQIDFMTNMVTFTDTITYTNLMPGEKYRAEGVLMDKASNTELIDGNTDAKITASTEFVPETTDGTVDVVFTFDASNIGIDYTSLNVEDTQKSTVVFEEVYLIGNSVADELIAEHKDINDEDQSMMVGNFLADELIETGEIAPLGDAGVFIVLLAALNAGLFFAYMHCRKREELI